MAGRLIRRTWNNIFRTVNNKDNGKKINDSNQENHKLFPSMEDNVQTIKNMLGNSSDIVFRRLKIGLKNKFKICIIYTDNLIDTLALQELIDALLNSITEDDIDFKNLATGRPSDVLIEKVVTVGEATEVGDFNTLLTIVLSAQAAILIENQSQAITVNIPGFDKRSIEEPQSATLIKGPRDGFIESIGTNTSLLRRRIRSANLWMESKEIGSISKTKVVVAYIKGIANEDVVQEVHKRLDRINIDAILESGYIEELIRLK